MTTLTFLLAIVPPFLYAATNHLDNILLEKYFKEGGVGTLMLFSALLSILAVPILYFIDPTVLAVDLKSIGLLSLVGFLNVLLLWAYLQALFNDEPTVVIIYYQLVPVIGLGLGYWLLGEVLTITQIVAMSIIILGAVLLTIALDKDGKITFRFKTAFFMSIAASCWALESTLFKVVALEENPWRSLFWEHVALVVFGAILYLSVKKYRDNFKKALRFNSGPVLALNVANESTYMVANSIAAFVVLLIPVSLTLLMNSFQPLFVLILGVMLMLVFPKLDVEHVNARNMAQKIIAIVLTGIGAYILGWW